MKDEKSGWELKGRQEKSQEVRRLQNVCCEIYISVCVHIYMCGYIYILKSCVKYKNSEGTEK